MIQTILTAAFLLAPQAAQDTQGPIFPPSSGPLTIEISADAPGINYLDLVRSYGELTGQHITFAEETKQLLTNTTVNLDRTVTVPALEVQTFVEHLLVRGGFVVTVLKDDGVRLLQVSSLHTAARNNLRAGAYLISSDRTDIAKAHPAVLFMVVVSLPNTDVRQVSNSMRTMITDANTQQMLPAGNSNSMVIVGFGSQLAAMAQMLREIDAASAPATDVDGETFEVIHLEKATAEDLALTITQLIDSAAQVGGPAGVQGGPQGVRMLQARPRVFADKRTNSLLISGKPDEIANIKELVARLDT